MKRSFTGRILEIVSVIPVMVLIRFIFALMFGISPTEFIQQIESEFEIIYRLLSVWINTKFSENKK